jgi:predicted DCC family thiol-disulfide oxidoreductase YuxK
MKNKILIYDDNCPLCTWYSGLFVKYGLLEADGRRSFSDLEAALLDKIDFLKSRNEIPLLDTQSGHVLYGIDSLLEILGQKFPSIKKTGNIKPVKWILKKMYKLVSYNRKLIVAKKCSTGNVDCTPDINYLYRVLFMVLSLLFNTAMLFPLYTNVFSKLSFFNHSASELQAAHFVLVAINCTLTLSFKKETAFEFIGQVNMLALIAVLLLMPLLFICRLAVAEWFIIFYLAVTSVVIVKEYLRRMEYAGVLSKNNWIAAINFISIAAFILYLFR